MEPSKEQIVEAQIQAIRKLTGKSRLEALKIIQNQLQFNEYVMDLIIKEEQRVHRFEEGLNLQVKKLMEEYGYSRKEALLLIKEVLEDNQIIHKSPNPEVK